MASCKLLAVWIALSIILSGSNLLAQDKPDLGSGESKPAGKPNESGQDADKPAEEARNGPIGYRPLRPPAERAAPPSQERDPLITNPWGPKKEEPKTGLFQARFYYRQAFINGTDVGDDVGSFRGDTPTADRAFGHSRGAGLDIERWMTPLLAIRTSVSWERLNGRSVSTPVDRVTFDDLEIFKVSIGPRLSWPIAVGSSRWGDPSAIPEMQGMVPYVRLGFGWAISSAVDVHVQSSGQTMHFWSQTGSFHFIFAMGFEYHWRDLGAFVEFGVDTAGPLNGNGQVPEAKDYNVTEYPFMFGLNWRF